MANLLIAYGIAALTASCAVLGIGMLRAARRDAAAASAADDAPLPRRAA